MRRPGRAANTPAKRLACRARRRAMPRTTQAGRLRYRMTQAGRPGCGRLAPRPRQRPDRNAAGESHFGGRIPAGPEPRSLAARPATGPDLEAAREGGPADLPLPHARLPARPPASDATTATATRAASSSLSIAASISGSRRCRHPIEATTSPCSASSAARSARLRGGAEEGDLPSRPPRGPKADRLAMFPQAFRSTGLANRPGTTPPG